MTKELTLKGIILNKINNLLNPNYINKIIFLTFSLGSVMILKKVVFDILLSLEIITKSFYLKAQLNDASNNFVFYTGCFFVATSLFFFYKIYIFKNVKKNKIYKSLKSASYDIRRLLEENNRIFKECAPNSSYYVRDNLRMDFTTWEQSKAGIIVPNNDQIYKILNNIRKISDNDKIHVSKMKSHIEHFKAHVENPSIDYSNHQFPISFSNLIYRFSKPSRKQKRVLNNISNWLLKHELLSNTDEIVIYGSALYHERFNDIDLIIKTKYKTSDEIKSNSSKWQGLEQDFHKKFKHNLHLSVYSDFDKDSYNSFIGKLNNFKRYNNG